MCVCVCVNKRECVQKCVYLYCMYAFESRRENGIKRVCVCICTVYVFERERMFRLSATTLMLNTFFHSFIAPLSYGNERKHSHFVHELHNIREREEEDEKSLFWDNCFFFFCF